MMTPAQEQLRNTLSDLNEDMSCAAWEIGWGSRSYEIVVTGAAEWDSWCGGCGPEMWPEIRAEADAAGGWWAFETFVAWIRDSSGAVDHAAMLAALRVADDAEGGPYPFLEWAY